MNKTIFIGAEKIDDNSFYIDVLYYSATSYSKSLYPTITRYFRKYAMDFMGGGTYSSKEVKIYEGGIYDGLHAHAPYFIKRTIYTKN